MTDSMEFQVAVGGLISSSSSEYEVQALLGSGGFGEVAQCRITATNEIVALKVLKRCTHYMKQAKEEMLILKTLKELGSDKFNIVTWNDSFTFGGRFCLEFEKLDISLLKFLQRRRFQPLSLMEIRPIVQQLATALDFMKTAGIVHADLKPENIMMVDHEHQPLKVKVIDFGLALKNPASQKGTVLQTLWYRAPEIMLGARFNEAIDVWSLGCTAAEMLMNAALFPGVDEFDMMRHIYYTVGHPPEEMLNPALYAREFYSLRLSSIGKLVWRFLPTPEGRKYSQPRRINSLSDLMTRNVSPDLPENDRSADHCDRENFVNLLTETLKVVGAERITPSQILLHPFVTMSHLVGKFENSSYVKKSIELMNICKGVSSDDETSICTVDLTHDEDPQEEDHVFTGENSPTKKRKRDGEDDTESGERRPRTNPEKKARTEPETAEQTQTGEITCSQKSPLPKRKRDDASECATSDDISPLKKRRVDLGQQLMDSVKKLFSSTEAALPEKAEKTQTGEITCSQNSPLLKRKRDDASECATSDDNSPLKKRRVDLGQQLMDSVKKLFSSTEAALPSQTQTQKRKRDEEEAGDSVKSSPAKLRKGHAVEKEVETADK